MLHAALQFSCSLDYQDPLLFCSMNPKISTYTDPFLVVSNPSLFLRLFGAALLLEYTMVNGLLLCWWRQAHVTPVYNIEWNSFLPNIFISCAAEWSVKIWDMDYRCVNLHSKDRSNCFFILAKHLSYSAASHCTPLTLTTLWAMWPGLPTPPPLSLPSQWMAR